MKLLFIYPKDRMNLGLTLATAAYEKIWLKDGERIQQVLARYTGLHFQQKEIRVEVHDGVSLSGTLDTPMRLNLRNDTLHLKCFALIHELGHRLLSGNGIGSKEEDDDEFVEEEHMRLYLFEGEVIQALYGNGVYAEWSRLRKENDTTAYEWASRLTVAERQTYLRRMVDTNELSSHTQPASL